MICSAVKEERTRPLKPVSRAGEKLVPFPSVLAVASCARGVTAPLTL